MSELNHPRALLQWSADYLATALWVISAADLGRPTPCPGWNVRDLVSHVAEAADELTSRAGGARDVSHAGADLAAHARARVSHFLAAVESAEDGEERAAAAAHGGAIELAAHGWDLNAAISGDQLSDSHATAVLDLAESLIDDEARARFFGPTVTIDSSASPSDRFVAFLGRDPGWEA